jgi:haloalkane dehalogenase
MASAAYISPAFPYESHFIDVYGSQMHYIDEGIGDPILFLHGNPTSSYLWRNVIPHLTPLGRCIALDLIGMGKSDSPEIEYRFVDHARYLHRFIETLQLNRMTLVIHDWGSALGFHYAQHSEQKIKGIAFMEAILMAAPSWDGIPEDVRTFLQRLRNPTTGWELAVDQNIFIEQVLPNQVLRGLSDDEMMQYRAPFIDPARRKPLWRWPNEAPIAGEPADVVALVISYNRWLQQTDLPKLLIVGRPGTMIGAAMSAWCQDHLKHLTLADGGPGLHFLQEDSPEQVGTAIAQWYTTL